MNELDEELCHLAWFPIAVVWTGCVVACVGVFLAADRYLNLTRRHP